jgi:hypothetical protein
LIQEPKRELQRAEQLGWGKLEGQRNVYQLGREKLEAQRVAERIAQEREEVCEEARRLRDELAAEWDKDFIRKWFGR